MKKKWLIPLTCMLVLLTGCADYGKKNISNAFDAMEKKNYQEASNEFQEAIKKAEAGNNKNENATAVLQSAYRGMGMLNYEESNYEQSLDNLQKALDLGAEQTTEIYNLIGVCQMNLEQYGPAADSFGSGIALADTEKTEQQETLLQEMYYNKVICYEQQAEWEKAKEAAKDYTERYPEDERMQKEEAFLSTR